MSVEEQRYLDAMRDIDLAIKIRQRTDPHDTSTANLRLETIGSLVESGALSELLIEKGIFTKEEYKEKLALHAEAHRDTYQKWVKNHVPPNYRPTDTIASL